MPIYYNPTNEHWYVYPVDTYVHPECITIPQTVELGLFDNQHQAIARMTASMRNDLSIQEVEARISEQLPLDDNPDSECTIEGYSTSRLDSVTSEEGESYTTWGSYTTDSNTIGLENGTEINRSGDWHVTYTMPMPPQAVEYDFVVVEDDDIEEAEIEEVVELTNIPFPSSRGRRYIPNFQPLTSLSLQENREVMPVEILVCYTDDELFFVGKCCNVESIREEVEDLGYGNSYYTTSLIRECPIDVYKNLLTIGTNNAPFFGDKRKALSYLKNTGMRERDY